MKQINLFRTDDKLLLFAFKESVPAKIKNLIQKLMFTAVIFTWSDCQPHTTAHLILQLQKF